MISRVNNDILGENFKKIRNQNDSESEEDFLQLKRKNVTLS